MLYLNNKLDVAKNIVKNIIVYIEDIKEYNKNVINLENNASDILKNIQLVNILQTIDGTLHFAEYSKKTIIMFAKYCNIFIDMCELISTLSLNTNLVDNSITSSDTVKELSAKALNNIIVENEIMNKKYLDDETNIISLISDKIVSKLFKENDFNVIEETDFLQITDYLYRIFKNNDSSIRLYAKILQNILNKLQYLSKKTFMYVLINEIEKQKNEQITMVEHATSPSSRIHHKNPLTKRFGLCVATRFEKISKILSLIFNNQITGNIESISKSKKTGFIILTGIAPSAFEYNIDNIIKDEGTARNDNFGINKEMIERFQTIKLISEKNKWKFSIKFINENLSNICVLETINGKDYRILTPWGPSSCYIIKKDMVDKLIEYGQNNATHDRSSKYNNVCITESRKNMFLRKPMHLDVMETQSKDFDINMVQNNLLIRIMNVINEKLIKNNLTHKKILDVLKSPDIVNVFFDEMIKSYDYLLKSVTSGDQQVNTFSYEETFSSYFYSIQTMKIKFMKSIYDTYVRSMPTSEELQNTNQIETILEKNIIKNVENILNGNDNIFNVINFKYIMLSYI